MRTRVRGIGLLVLGVLVGALGVIPSGWTGQLHGVGGGSHLLADGVLAAGVVLLIVGLIVLLRAQPPSPAARLSLPSKTTQSVAPLALPEVSSAPEAAAPTPLPAGSAASGAAAPPPPESAPRRRLCATQALKNVKAIRAVNPHVFPSIEPLEGYASVVPFDVLQRFHQMTDEELRPYPQLLEAAHTLRQNAQTSAPHAPAAVPAAGGDLGASGPQAAPSPSARDTLFHGVLYFVQITFNFGGSSAVVSDADMVTMIEYTALALPTISRYTAQYGDSQVSVFSDILKLQKDLPPTGIYNDHMLAQWLGSLAFDDLVSTRGVSPESICFVVPNPPGVINSDATGDVYGYHHSADYPAYPVYPYSFPYCFIDVLGSDLTIQDEADHYAASLSHEIAEMIVNPSAQDVFFGGRPEVCDPCANCEPAPVGLGSQANWRAFFAVSSDGLAHYVTSTDGTTVPLSNPINNRLGGVPQPRFRWDFYIAAIVPPLYVNDCPSIFCTFGPDAQEGLGQLLFYEEGQEPGEEYVEVYSINAAGGIALQTTAIDWGALVPPPPPSSGGRQRPRPPTPAGAADPQNLPSSPHPHPPTPAGVADPQNSAGDWGGRAIIVPGKYTTKPSGSPLDVLFYEGVPGPTGPTGHGQFYQTGLLGVESNANHRYDDWRGAWSLIIPGNFSSSPHRFEFYNDLLFYDRSSGTGEFYHTADASLVSYPFARYTDWRTTWSQIIPCNFSPSPTTDLLFYDPSSGTGEFYHTDGTGLVLPPFARYTDWRTTWSQIIPGKFSDSPYTDLLFYDPSTGTGEFYHTDGGGLVFPLFATLSDVNARTQIIPGKFSQSPTTDLLFYDRSSGTGVFYHTDGSGLVVPPFATYTDWRTTWSIIVSLSR